MNYDSSRFQVDYNVGNFDDLQKSITKKIYPIIIKIFKFNRKLSVS